MRASYIVAAAVLLSASAAPAQTPSVGAVEIRPFVGAYVPTGRLAEDFAPAALAGTQVALALTPGLRLVASGSWSGTRNRPTVVHRVRSVWQYDLGTELATRPLPLGGWEFRPFVGAGAGGRTYDYQHAAMSNATHAAGYAALGHELTHGPLAVRCEARDYLAGYHSPADGAMHTRNDLGFMFGVALRL